MALTCQPTSQPVSARESRLSVCKGWGTPTPQDSVWVRCPLHTKWRRRAEESGCVAVSVIFNSDTPHNSATNQRALHGRQLCAHERGTEQCERGEDTPMGRLALADRGHMELNMVPQDVCECERFLIPIKRTLNSSVLPVLWRVKAAVGLAARSLRHCPSGQSFWQASWRRCERCEH